MRATPLLKSATMAISGMLTSKKKIYRQIVFMRATPLLKSATMAISGMFTLLPDSRPLLPDSRPLLP